MSSPELFNWRIGNIPETEPNPTVALPIFSICTLLSYVFAAQAALEVEALGHEGHCGAAPSSSWNDAMAPLVAVLPLSRLQGLDSPVLRFLT